MGIILHSHLQPLFILFFLNMDINLNTEPEPEPELEISPEREREDDRIKPLWLGRRRSRRQTDEIKQMEGNTSSGPMHVDHQQHPQTLHQQHTSHNLQGSMVDPPICENFPMSVGNMHESEQPMGLMNYNKGDKGKICTSQDDKPSFSGSSCQRIKWTDEMAKLLINVVSCTGEERKSAILLKGKWKAVSQVMFERGFSVTSSQCEDKFHELNRRYKQLIDPLGWDNACKVVKNHELMGTMGHLSLKAREAVWKSLSSKHLFFEEMSSYHNGNRLDQPYDPKLRISLQLALKRDDDHDSRNVQEDFNDDDSWTLDKHARHTSDSVRDRVPLAICGPILSGKSPPPDEGTVGSSVFTSLGPACDSLGALTSSSFNSYSAAEMLKAVPLYGSATRDFLNLIAANQRLLEAAIREKEFADMASLRVQLQREQERARGLETQLADAKAEQGRVKSLEEEIVQLKNNEAQLNAKITNAEAATTELARQLAEAKEEYRTELAAKIKEGVKEFVDKKRAIIAAKKSGSGSIPSTE